ncbi:uncharacterized protein METZ01_LOCUS429174, partial [marine metagenome]
DQENYIFGDHDDCNKVDTFWGISTQATIEVEGSGAKKNFKKEIDFNNLVTDTNITYRKFKETKYYFLGFSLNEGESLSCVINEEFEVSRLKFCFIKFSAPEIADIILTDVSYVLADSGEEIEFSSDGDTTHKGNLFDIFRGSDCIVDKKKTKKNKNLKKSEDRTDGAEYIMSLDINFVQRKIADEEWPEKKISKMALDTIHNFVNELKEKIEGGMSDRILICNSENFYIDELEVGIKKIKCFDFSKIIVLVKKAIPAEEMDGHLLEM